MNVIEVLSNKYNFSMDEAVSLFAVKNKSKKTKKDGQSLEDMFAELVNDVEQDTREPVIVLEPALESDAVAVAPVVKEKKEKAKKQPLSEEAKKQKAEELIAAKEAAKKQKAEELIAAKEAAKKQKADELLAAKKQKADELLAQKEAAKKQKEDEKLAAKEAAKAAKEPKAKAVKEPKAKAVKAVNEPKAVKAVNKEDSVDITDMPPIKITVTRVKIGDQTYLKSTAGILYNADTKEEVGLHDEATNTIKSLPEDGDEELEEDTYDA